MTPAFIDTIFSAVPAETAVFSLILHENLWVRCCQRCTATSKEKPKEGVKTENDHINLKLVGQDGSMVQFKIKRHTPLSKLMKAYYERQGLSMRQIRFRFDGQPINETDTPAQLEMEVEDTIDVFQRRIGGMASRGTIPHPAILLAFVVEW
nr:small ubiquitin-related modifier 3-like [Ictidomys tridecemlineatus]